MKIKKILGLLACLAIGVFVCKAAPPDDDVLDPKVINYARIIIENYNPDQYYNLDEIKKTFKDQSFTCGNKKIKLKEVFPKLALKTYRVAQAPYVPLENLDQVAKEATEIFKKEPPLLEIDSKKGILFAGDLHGDVTSAKNLMLMFLDLYESGKIDKVVILGDYTDREFFGAETLFLLYEMKILMPNHLYMTKGNHEDPNCQKGQRCNTLVSELKNKYKVIDCEDFIEKYNDVISLTPNNDENISKDSVNKNRVDYKDQAGVKLLKSINESYRWLPVAAVVKLSRQESLEEKPSSNTQKYFCVHGGLANEILGKNGVQTISEITRPCNDENELVHQLTWNEGKPIEGNTNCKCQCNGRFIYGGENIINFLANNGFNGIVSGHVHKNTCSLYNDGDKEFSQLTLLSADKYGGNTNNKGCAGLISNSINGNNYPVPVHLSNWKSVVELVLENDLPWEDIAKYMIE